MCDSKSMDSACSAEEPTSKLGCTGSISDGTFEWTVVTVPGQLGEENQGIL